MARPSTATRAAEKFLREYILRERSVGGRVSVACLAAQAGVSYLTMWKVVRRFKDQGELHGKYRISLQPHHPDKSEPRNSASRIESRFLQDLLCGAITRGIKLNSMKELCSRYATSSPTLRRIISNAAKQGLLFPHGRHWAVIRKPASGQLTIVFVEYVRDRSVLKLSFQEREILNSCEKACRLANVNISIVAQDIEIGKPDDELRIVEVIDHSPTVLPVGENIAGYVCLPQAFTSAVRTAVLATGKPIALYASGMQLQPDAATIRVFNFANTRTAGASMASHLLAKGHRRIAYVSPFHADAWSRLRCEAVSDTFERAGEGHCVSHFTKEHSTRPHVLAVQGRTHGRMSELTSRIASWRMRVPACFQPGVDALVDEALGYMFFEGEVRGHLDALLDASARDPAITAWVLANDLCARLSLDYCRKNRIAVPSTVAIVGFDDEVENREQGITSFSFNYDAAAQAMVQYLLHPKGTYWHAHRSVEVDGTVVERASG